MTAPGRFCCCGGTVGDCGGCSLCSSSYSMSIAATGTWDEGAVTYSFTLSASGTVSKSAEGCVYEGDLTGSLIVTGSGVYADTYALPATQSENFHACITIGTVPPTEVTRFSYNIRLDPGLGGVFLRTLTFFADIDPSPCPSDNGSALDSAVDLSVLQGGFTKPSSLTTFSVAYT